MIVKNNTKITNKRYPFRGYDTSFIFCNEKNEHIAICFNTETEGSENFQSYNDLHFKQNTVIAKKYLQVNISKDENFNCDSGSKYIFTITTSENKSYKIVLSNNHNGWYYHKVIIDSNGYLTWSSEI